MPPDLAIAPVKIPAELEDKFSGLISVTTYFIDYVLRISAKKRRGKKKVLIVTERAVFICEPEGYINRCIQLSDVERLVYGGQDDHFALCVPREGAEGNPSFDALFRTGNVVYLTTVLKELMTKRVRKQVILRAVPSSETFPFETINLTQPPGWTISLHPDVLECVSNDLEFSPPDERRDIEPHPSPPMHPGGTPAGGPGIPLGSGLSGIASSHVAAAQHAAPQGQAPSALSIILKKLEVMDSDIQGIKQDQHLSGRRSSSGQTPHQHQHYHSSPSPRRRSREQQSDRGDHERGGGGGVPQPGDAAARELSLRSYEEVKAIRKELASGGYIKPSVAWGDIFPTSVETTEPYSHPHPHPHLQEKEVFCWHCHRDLSDQSTVPRCSNCKRAVYCGRQCQTVHWGRHKLECASLEQSERNGSPEPILYGGVGGGAPSPSPQPSPRQVYVVGGPVSVSPRSGSKKKKKKKKKASVLPPPPVSPPPPVAAGPAPSAVLVERTAPDALRDRVYDTSKSLPDPTAGRPLPPPAPHQIAGGGINSVPGGGGGASYEELFHSYRDYYAEVLSGEDPAPPATLYS